MFDSDYSNTDIFDSVGQRLEILCNRHDLSLSIIDAFKQRADEFILYVHTIDNNALPLDFTNAESVLAQEMFKKQVLDKARNALSIEAWDESWFGTGKIAEELRPIINDTENKLINRLSKTEFNDYFRKENIGKRYRFDPRAERVIYNIYKNNDDKESFQFATKVFGRRYPIIAFLFFIKDDLKYLPIAPENFENCFGMLNIKIKLQGRCDWDNYNEYLELIDCIRALMSAYMPLAHEPTLLEAHSFVWMIGGNNFTNWLQGRKNREIQEKEERLKKQAKEEREKNRIPSKALSEISDEDLVKIGPFLEGRVINNARYGSVEVLKFVLGKPPTMSIIYTDLDGDEAKDIELTDMVRRNFTISLELLKSIVDHEKSDSESDNDSDDKDDSIVFSADELKNTRDYNKNNHISERQILNISKADINDSEQEEDNMTRSVEDLMAMQIESEKYEYVPLPEKRKEVNGNTSDKHPTAYPRDRQKRINALIRAGFMCECDNAHTSFISKKTDKPYMETHHLIPLEYWSLFDNSLDVEANIVSLCSNCHNEIHYGKNADELVKILFAKRKNELTKAGIDIELTQLQVMYDHKREASI